MYIDIFCLFIYFPFSFFFFCLFSFVLIFFFFGHVHGHKVHVANCATRFKCCRKSINSYCEIKCFYRGVVGWCDCAELISSSGGLLRIRICFTRVSFLCSFYFSQGPI